jgi:heat shock protein HtpX
MYKAKPVAVEEDTQLFAIVEELTKRAGLSRISKLFYIPSQMINAFATGTRDNALIGVTDGILRALDGKEITAVLAHEMSHIKNNDIKVMGMADTIMRVTHMLSGIGKILLIVNLPLILAGKGSFSWLAVVLLIFAPNIATILQLGLSRAREYDADVGAVDLTKDRIERLQLMADELQQDRNGISPSDTWQAGFLPNNQAKQPRWHLSGLWF